MADIFDMADTWNNGATTFTAIKMNVTDTASAAASLLLDLQVGGVSRASISKTGKLMLGGGVSAGQTTIGTNLSGAQDYGIGWDTSAVGFSSFGSLKAYWSQVGTVRFQLTENSAYYAIGSTATGGDVRIYRDAADTLAQRRGVNAQAFNIYNTFTDASNYERAHMGWTGNAFVIAPQAAGTGTTRVLHISGLPTSNPGPGILWNNAGTPAIGT